MRGKAEAVTIWQTQNENTSVSRFPESAIRSSPEAKTRRGSIHVMAEQNRENKRQHGCGVCGTTIASPDRMWWNAKTLIVVGWKEFRPSIGGTKKQ
jgi:hypothetical protein